MKLERFTNKKITFLSAHYDDVAFSLAGFIYNITNFNACEVINIFSTSNFIYGGTDEIDKSTAIRKKEDQFALRNLGINNISYAQFPEALVRNVGRKDLFHKGTSKPILNENFVQTITTYLLQIPEDRIIFIPACFGGHIDHLTLQEASKKLVHDKVYYADLPYAGNNNRYSNQYATHFTDTKQKLSFDINKHDLEFHLEICKKYKSQFEMRFVTSIMKFLSKNEFILWV